MKFPTPGPGLLRLEVVVGSGAEIRKLPVAFRADIEIEVRASVRVRPIFSHSFIVFIIVRTVCFNAF